MDNPNFAITDIIFDLGGVLLDLNMDGFGEACRRFGINPGLFFVKADAANNSTVCDGLSASQAITDYQVGQMSSEAFLTLAQGLCPKGTSRQRIVDAWNSCIGTIPRHRLDLIAQLRQHGYRTHLLSNTNELHWSLIRQRYFSDKGYTCADLFDQMFLSQEVHLAKPDPEIYRHAVRQIGRHAWQCLFIDDAQVNVEAAKREGLQGAWLDVTREGHLQEILQGFIK
ncbi:MAG: HAD family phosphatase [Prevotellaceae bacterium]|nr:HAD family phosphatase [Prevotellaceae bacterium]